MKKIYFILMLFVCSFLSTSCGKRKMDEYATSDYYDIQSESELLYDVAAVADTRKYFLGAQFYQEEPVQIWAFVTVPNSGKADICLYRADGSSELLYQDMSEGFLDNTKCLIDSEGNLYFFYNIFPSKYGLMKINSSGELLYKHQNEGRMDVRDICQLQDGRIFFGYDDYSNIGVGNLKLEELDPDTGSYSEVTSVVWKSTMHMGNGGKELLYPDSDGIYEVSIENGSKTNLWPFIGTTYEWESTRKLWDFRITEEGDLQILWGKPFDEIQDSVFLETLRRVNIGAGKIPIVMRGTEFTGIDGGWFKEMVALFNKENKDYFVVLEECGSNADWDDYARQTSIEVGTGKGPDILYGDVLGEYLYGIIEKGGLTDLSPYMKKTKIKEKDYFPCAFGCWRDGEKIYSVTTKMLFFITGAGGYSMDAAVLGGAKEPDIETLVDALLSWQENAIYMDNVDSQGVLEMLLEGTENLWGMIDWEAGTCDFDNELFAKILETAKRYGYDSKNNFRGLLNSTAYYPFSYMDSAMLEREGKVMVGTLFDDGYHAKLLSKNFTLAMNANSTQKEGAWEFIRFLLEEKAQEKSTYEYTSYPVNREVFEAWIEKEQSEGRQVVKEDGRRITKGPYELTDDRVKELKEILDEVRFIPVKTVPILDIIYDEAQDYFDGIKSIEEIRALINNRVQLYLDETR